MYASSQRTRKEIVASESLLLLLLLQCSFIRLPKTKQMRICVVIHKFPLAVVRNEATDTLDNYRLMLDPLAHAIPFVRKVNELFPVVVVVVVVKIPLCVHS